MPKTISNQYTNHSYPEPGYLHAYFPRASDYRELHTRIKNLIEKNNEKVLLEVLKSPFIYPGTIQSNTESVYTGPRKFEEYRVGPALVSREVMPDFDIASMSEVTHFTYQSAPLLVELVVNHKKDYQAMLATASPECQTILRDFSGLDFDDANLKKVDFTQANLSNAKLQKTKGLAQCQLDNSANYLHASLPKGLFPFWTDKTRKSILSHINDLKDYGKHLKHSKDYEGQEKGKLAIQLAIDLQNEVNSTSNYNGAFQANFLDILHRHDEEFSHKRYYGLKTILINIALFCASLGVGYIAAGIYNYSTSRNIFFFNQTRTQELVTTIEDTLHTEPERIVNGNH